MKKLVVECISPNSTSFTMELNERFFTRRHLILLALAAISGCLYVRRNEFEQRGQYDNVGAWLLAEFCADHGVCTMFRASDDTVATTRCRDERYEAVFDIHVWGEVCLRWSLVVNEYWVDVCNFRVYCLTYCSRVSSVPLSMARVTMMMMMMMARELHRHA